MAIHFHEEDLPSTDIFAAGVPIAVDTEAMGLIPGRDRLCLVQLSDGSGDEHLVRFGPDSDYAAPNLKALLADPAGADGVFGTADDDYHPQPASPCIDVGDPAFSPAAGEKDIEGNARLRHCRVDIGAYESSFIRDCDGNSVPDSCDLKGGLRSDCNRNGVPDACEVLSDTRLLVTDSRRASVLLFDAGGAFERASRGVADLFVTLVCRNIVWERKTCKGEKGSGVSFIVLPST